MLQRLHPEITWAKPYHWVDVPTDDLRPLGAPTTVRVDGQDLVLDWSGGVGCRIAAVAPGMVRLGWTHPRVAELPASGGVVLAGDARDADAYASVDGAKAWLHTDGWVLALDSGRLAWGPAQGPPAIEWHSLGLAPAERGFRLLADFALTPDEALHGCGGRTGPVNRRGSTCDFYAVKVDGPENGDYGGLPMPFVMSSRGAAMFLDNPWPHVYADFGYDDPTRMRWYAPGGPAQWYLLAGPAPIDMLRRWHVLTGAPTLPPTWYQGFWMSYNARTTAEQWTGWIDRFRAEGWPLDVVVLDLEWRGGNLIAGEEGGDGIGLDWHATFGDGAGLVRHAAAHAVQTILHLNTRQFGHEVRAKGLAEGWLRVVDEQCVIDPSTPAKADAAWAVHAPRIADGIAGWWTDNGERVEGELGEGLPSRNLFGMRWDAFLHARTARAGLPGRLVLTRGDWVGAQRHASPWPGDTCPGVDRLDEDLRFILNCAVSGVPFSGTDLGGYRGGKDGREKMDERMKGAENIVRRVVHAFLYQPIARVHNGGAAQKFPWVFDERIQQLWRTYLGLRYRLLPWWRSAAVRAATESVPMVRPLWFDYPDDPALRDIEDEMLVGDGLLAAPVVRDAAWDRRVYLPAGRWYHYWSGTPFEGGREYIVDAHVDAVDGLPLFVRGGSVLVYGPPCDRCPTEAPDELWIDAYPGGSREGAIRWDADTPPLLGWQFNGSTLRLTAGPRTLRLHVANGGSLQTLVLAPDAQACVTMDPPNGPCIPTPLGGMREELQ